MESNQNVFPGNEPVKILHIEMDNVLQYQGQIYTPAQRPLKNCFSKRKFSYEDAALAPGSSK